MEQMKVVDGFRFLPPGLKAWVKTFIPDEGDYKGTIPWTPMSKPLNQTTLALVTSAGISLKTDLPFDMEREKREPLWGDRSYRAIPRGTSEKEIDVNHLHINTNLVKQDINVIHQNRLQDAESVLREEIRLGSPDENTQYALGQTLAQQNRHQEAVECFRAVLALDPNLRMAHYALSQSLLSLGREKDSEDSLKRFKALKEAEDSARKDPTLGSTNRPEQLRYTSDTWMDAALLIQEGRAGTQDPSRRAALDAEFLRALMEALCFEPNNVQALLARYRTLTGLCEAQVAAGIDVHVLQRFRCAERLSHRGVSYHFLADDPTRSRPFVTR